MTDKEIIKAIECLFGCVDCRECPYSPRYEFPLCQRQVAKDTLDLINRQQAKIEELVGNNDKLNIELQSMRSAANSLKMHYEEVQAEIERLKTELDFAKAFRKETDAEFSLMHRKYGNMLKAAKSEAYKECIEKVRKLAVGMHPCSDELRVFDSDLDNLLKEWVGDNNA